MTYQATQPIKQPKQRSELRLKLGRFYYGTKRKLVWLSMNRFFANVRRSEKLPFQYSAHKTILLRQLKDVDMWMQENKVINLRLATQAMNGIILCPGEIFSYWKLIGKPSRKKGYVEGMILKSGSFEPGIGGGLCQLSNLIFWMTIHTPLSVIERHRHGYDVFPDSNRTQPFGSGATCYYPYGDLMIKNNTNDTFQLFVHVGDQYLEGEWRVSKKPEFQYEIIEKNHRMTAEYWGGYSRHNEIYQLQFDQNHNLLKQQLIVVNDALMMYCPFIEKKN